MSNLPKGWAYSTIGEVADYINGRAFKPSEWETVGKPIIRIQNLNDSSAKCNFSRQDIEQKYLIRNGDLLFAWSASLGAYLWKGQDAWLNQHIFKVEPRIDKFFLYYLLSKYTLELYAKAHGSGMVHVTKGKFEETEIPLPPLNEQKRIVAKIEELFSELDKGIENLKTAREQLKVYRQAVLKHAFEGKLTADWREKNKDKLKLADKLIECVKQAREAEAKKQGKRKLKETRPFSDEDFSWLSDLPSNWCWERLGWMTCGIEYGTGAKSSEMGDVPVLRMGNIQNMKFDWSDLVYTSDQEEIQSYLLKKGDVLFNRTNSPELVGKTAIYNGERPALFAGYLMRINQIDSIIDARYLNFYLNSHTAKQYGNKVKTDGVNQSNINGEKLAHYPFPYCSLEEQKVIVGILDDQTSSIDRTEADIEFQLNKAEALRQSILKKAFSGELVAQDPNDEPASVLLERIRAEKESQPVKKKSKEKRRVA